jgi:hypothetical protein
MVALFAWASKKCCRVKEGRKIYGASMNKNIITPTYCIEYIHHISQSHVTRHTPPTPNTEKAKTGNKHPVVFSAQ